MAKTSYFVFAAALLASTISVSGIQAADARAEAPKLTSASAFIRFDDAADQDGIRPVPYDAQLTLYQQVWSGNSYAAAAPVAGSQKTVRIAEGVSFVSLAGDDGWNDLPEGDDIHPTRYTARLDNVPTGYADPPVYTYNGEYEVPDGNTDTVITLQHNVAITSKTVAITWDDNDSPERPATVELQLLGNGTPVGDPVEVGASTGWSHVFTSLAANYGGHPIDYTVVQTGLTRYETALNPTADGIEIVNTLAASGISWPVYKIWDDDFNRDGIRSAATTLVLEAAQPVGGTVEAPEYGPYEQVGDPLTLTQADCWFRQWTSLPETVTGGPFDGWPIGYRVSETSVPDSYTSTKTDFTVVNSHEIATTSWTLRVEWDDGNDLDALRHSPKFNIFGGKRYYPTLTIPDDELGQNTWEYTWNDLPKYLAGKPLTFAILESYIPLDYAITQTADLHPSDISSSTDHTTIVGYSITNSHEPVTEPTTVGEDQWRAVVLWDDGDDAARVRPSSVQLTLDPEDMVSLSDNPAKVGAAEGWEYTWTLPGKVDCDVLEYSVVERGAGDDYVITSASDCVKRTTTITNRIREEGETTSKSVIVRWLDSNNAEGLRPATVRVLLAESHLEKGSWTSYKMVDPSFFSVKQNTVVELTGTAKPTYRSHDWTSLVNVIGGEPVRYKVFQLDDDGHWIDESVDTLWDADGDNNDDYEITYERSRYDCIITNTLALVTGRYDEMDDETNSTGSSSNGMIPYTGFMAGEVAGLGAVALLAGALAIGARRKR